MHEEALPTTPGAIIGYRKTGHPIRLIAGGSGEGDGGAGDTGTNDQGDGTGGSGTGDQGDTSNTSTGSDGAKSYDEAYVRRLRDEAAANRVKAKEAETAHKGVLDTIAQALGLKPADADPAKLAEQLGQEKAAARQARVELAVYRAATSAGVNVDALMDSRTFLAKLADLDPAADDFAKKVTDAVKEAARDPRFHTAGSSADRSGADMSGGGGGGGPRRPASLQDAVTNAYRH